MGYFFGCKRSGTEMLDNTDKRLLIAVRRSKPFQIFSAEPLSPGRKSVKTKEKQR